MDQEYKMPTDINKAHDQLIKLNKKLKNSLEAKSNFLWNIKNELNNPLTSVIGLTAQIQEMGDEQVSDVKNIAKIVHEEILHLNFQLNNIFLASEIESGEVDISYSNIYIDDLLTKVIDSFAHQADKKQITVKKQVDLQLKSHLFPTSPDKLYSILSNLLSNAIKYSNPHAEVYINATLGQDDHLHIEVIDSGVGMSKEVLNAIYDKFYHHNNLQIKSDAGTGLGMAIVKVLVEAIGGELNVQSIANKGTKVNIRINKSKESVEDLEDGFIDFSEM